MSARAVPQEAPFWHWWRLSVRVIAITLSAGVAGAGLVAVSWRFGRAAPVVLLGIALIPFVTLLVASDARVAVVIILAALPFNSIVPATELIPLQPLEIALLFSVSAIIIVRLAAGKAPLRWTPILWIALLALAWSLISLRDAASFDLGLKQVASFIGGLLVITAVSSVITTDRDLRVIGAVFAAVAALVAATALIGGSAPEAQFGGALVEGRLEGAFDQPNQLGAFSALTLFLAVGLAFGGRARPVRAFGWIVAGLLLGSLLLSLSRGAWIGTALAGLYLVIKLPEARRILVAVLVPFLALAAALGPSLSSSPQVRVIGERISAFTAENPYDNRPAIYEEATQQISERPITGYGPGSFPETSKRAAAETTTASADHAHNLWLTWSAEMGIPAALIFTALMLALASQARRAGRRARDRGDLRQRALTAGLVAALITVPGQGIVDYTWRNQAIFFSICTMVGLLISSTRMEMEE